MSQDIVDRFFNVVAQVHSEVRAKPVVSPAGQVEYEKRLPSAVQELPRSTRR
jgi:hypothetical protein